MKEQDFFFFSVMEEWKREERERERKERKEREEKWFWNFEVGEEMMDILIFSLIFCVSDLIEWMKNGLRVKFPWERLLEI